MHSREPACGARRLAARGGDVSRGFQPTVVGGCRSPKPIDIPHITHATYAETSLRGKLGQEIGSRGDFSCETLSRLLREPSPTEIRVCRAWTSPKGGAVNVCGSDDGLNTWDLRISPLRSTNWLYGIAYANDQFVTVGGGPELTQTMQRSFGSNQEAIKVAHLDFRHWPWPHSRQPMLNAVSCTALPPSSWTAR